MADAFIDHAREARRQRYLECLYERSGRSNGLYTGLYQDHIARLIADDMTATLDTTTGWIYQRQEDHPQNPGWWRYSRPEWVVSQEELPTSASPDTVRAWRGTHDDLTTAQAEWDAAHPRG